MRFISLLILIVFVGFTNRNFSQIIERGFGYSNLVHCRRGGADVTADRLADYSYLQIFSQKAYGKNSGKISETYHLTQSPEEQGAYILKTADVNGDGLDDIIVVYYWGEDINGDNIFDGSNLIVFNGIDGSRLFSYHTEKPGSFTTKCSEILIGDFNGDGKEDIAHFNYAGNDFNNDNLPDCTQLKIFNGGGNLLFERNFALTQPEGTIFLKSCVGDFNGDQSDDLLLAFNNEKKNVFELLGIDIKNNRDLFKLSVKNNFDFSFIKSIDIDKDGKDEFALVLNNIKADSTQLKIISTGGSILHDYSFAGIINNIFVDDFTNDYGKEIVLVKNGKSKNLINYSEILSINSDYSVQTIIPASQVSDSIYLADVSDFNNDGKKEIAFVRKIFGKNNSNVLSITDYHGNIFYNYKNDDYPAEVNKKEKIFFIGHGNFDGKGSNDVLIVHSWGVDVTSDGYGDNSYLIVKNISNNSTIFSFHPFDFSSGGYGGYLFATINNNISNKNLLRKINFNTENGTLSNVRFYFLKRDYKKATDALFNYYKGLLSFNPFEIKDYYANSGQIALQHYISNFSVFAGKEMPPINGWINQYRNDATISLRMKRFTSTFWYRLRNENNFNKENFLLLLKEIYAHLNFLSRNDQFTAGTNHGAIFELLGYFPAAVSLNIFKEFNSNSESSWLNVINNRLRVQLAHVLNDGVHDEHSFYYAFRVNLLFNDLLNFQKENAEFFNLSTNTINDVKEKIRKQNIYLMYAVKPVNIVRDSFYLFTQSDIPCIGDTKGIWGTNLYGKLFDKNISKSMLIYPEYSGEEWLMNDEETLSRLKFCAYGLVNSPNPYSPPTEVSKIFKTSGIFISRSNWTNKKGDFDSLARYCYFKGGEMIPTPGPYNGFSTSSYHAHADLETVEISAYGKNLLTELGGYVNPQDTQIINNLPSDYFFKLYNYNSDTDAFNTARHYFKGTAAHNTVYVNDEDQAEYLGHYLWGGVSKLKKTDFYYSINPQFDYYLSGYSKEFSYTHKREMIYLKPLIQDTISNDYWVFNDEIDFFNYGENKAEQIWHIAPLESNGDFNNENGVFRGKNFIIIPLKEKNKFDFSPEIIDSYNLTDLILIKTKSVKYTKISDGNKCKFFTIIFPFQKQSSFTDFSLNRIAVSDKFNEQVPADTAICVNLKFKEDDKTYSDYLFVSHAPGKDFFWSAGAKKIHTNNKFYFLRYDGNKLIKELDLPWSEIIKNGKNKSSGNFYFFNNYPNPFATVTKINFELKTPGNVQLDIFDILGNKIITLVEKWLRIGNYTYYWNGKNNNNEFVASGVYICRLSVNGKSKFQKVLKIK